MFRLISVLVFLGLVFFGISWLRQLPPGEKRRAVLKVLFGLLLVVLVYLTVTGRIHWLGALFAALLPLAKVLLGFAVQILPFLRNRQRQSNDTHRAHSGGGAMTVEEAMETLGLMADYRAGAITAKQVHEAHRRLMQKVHPDRGGNDYLAARVNEAKTVALDSVGGS